MFKFREAPHVLWEVLADVLGEGGHRPDAAHLALAACPGLLGIVTQNVDGLHQEAHREVHGGSVPMPPVVELHGTLLVTRCHGRDARPGRTAGSYVGTGVPRCERCDGPLRPDVVLFGERVAPERMGQALELVRRCDALLVVGTAMDRARREALRRHSGPITPLLIVAGPAPG